MNPPVSVKLSYELGAKLRALSNAVGLPTTDMIAKLLMFGAEHYRVPLPVHSVTVETVAGALSVTIDGFMFKPMKAQRAVSSPTRSGQPATGFRAFSTSIYPT